MTDSIDGVLAGLTAYEYDPLNRVDRIRQSGTNVAEKRVDLTYNPLGQMESLTRYSDLAGSQNVATSTYEFDGANRLSAIRHRDATDAVFAFYEYGYDAASRITSINDIDGLTAYQYDKRDQLTGADRAAVDPRGDEAYAYDGTGNRTSSHLHSSGYQTGTGNRLTSDGTYTYEYDAEGNLLIRTEMATGNTRHFNWDHRNRLTRVEDRDSLGVATQLVEFTYDVFDRRISKSVDTTPQDMVDGVVTHFVYDGENVILDFVDTDGTGPTAPTLTQRYLHGPGWDNLLAFETAAGAFWIAPDRLGSTRQVLNSSGAIEQNIRYDSFGNVSVDTSPLTRYQFTGREFDSETGLTYFRARYYDSKAGRFVSEDPIGFAGEDLNLSRYVGNQPVSNTDPIGLLTLKDYWEGAGDLLQESLFYETFRKSADAYDCGDILGGLGYGVLAGVQAGLVLFGSEIGKRGFKALDKLWDSRAGGAAARTAPKGPSGFEPHGVHPAPGTRVRPQGLPKGYRARPTDTKGGVEFYNPRNRNESVRIMQGNANSPYPNSRGPYVRQRDATGTYLRSDGSKSSLPRGGLHDPDTHIPIGSYPGFLR
jgi:RHS repeat-associated protein